MHMKRPFIAAVVLLIFGVAYGVNRALQPQRLVGVSAPSVFHPPLAGASHARQSVLYYSGQTNDSRRRLLVAELQESKEVSARQIDSEVLSALPPSALSAQQVDPDHVFYIAAEGSHGQTAVFASTRIDGEWQITEKPILRPGHFEEAGNKGIPWISVLPPDATNIKWRIWYIAPGYEGPSDIMIATSLDCHVWLTSGKTISVRKVAESEESVSVIPFGDGLQAWLVRRNLSTGSTQLLTAPVDSMDGRLIGIPEPVAWQAPKDWREGLPKDNIPIIDARADPMPDNPRHVRLLITYKGSDHKWRITVAENFPVNGVYSPTVFSRQVKPVLAP